MARRAIMLLLSLTLFAGSLAGAGSGEPVTLGASFRTHSAVLNEDRDYQVLLPDSYGWAQDRRYPVLYLLDGREHFLHTAASVGYLAGHGELPEMIVVAIASTKRVRDFTQSDWPQVWVGGGGAANFKRFLSSELIPEIEKTYRTDGFRILSGHSASGQFVLYCLTAEPSLFRGYLALSPSLDWDDNLPQRSLEKSFESASPLQAFLYVARSDDSGRALADFEKLVATLDTKAPKGLRWRGQAFPDETHGGLPLLGQIDALRSLYAGYRYHNDLLEKGLPAAQEQFKRFSETLGWPVPVPERVMNGLGYAALSQGRHEEAIAIFKSLTEANPNSANAYDSLADGYAEAQRWRDAATASEKALALATRFSLPNRDYFERQVKKWNDKLKPAP